MDEGLQDLYSWVDEVPLSRTKRNIARDFSDGVLMAEVCAHFYPKLVELHNYSAANSVQQKTYNWQTLNKKVFQRLQIPMSNSDVEEVVNCVPGVVEKVLKKLRGKVERDKFGVGGDMSGGSGHRSQFGGDRSDGSSVRSGGTGESRLRQQGISTGVKSQAGLGVRGPVKGPPDQGFSAASARVFQGQPTPVQSGYDSSYMQAEVDTEILVEKEQMIQELKETVEILETKVKKLEQLVRLKDTKIQSLTAKLQQQQGPMFSM